MKNHKKKDKEEVYVRSSKRQKGKKKKTGSPKQ